MWLGVGLAVALCLAVALILESVNHALPHKQQEGLATVLALVAVAGVTYMVVWMKRHSRELKGSLGAPRRVGAPRGLGLGARRDGLLRRAP